MSTDIKVNSPQELDLMRKSGQITAKALKKTLETVSSGVNLLSLEKRALKAIESAGGVPSFMTVADSSGGNYKWATCLTVNQEVVHGIPREEVVLKEGDLLSIDVGAIYEGWHTDAAWSVLVGSYTKSEIPASRAGGRNPKSEIRFLEVGQKALWKGIKQAVEGNHIGDISEAIQKTVEGSGYSVVRALVGHGVGRSLHENPEIPGFGKRGTGPRLFSGMTLAIEVIYTSGKSDVVLNPDGWTVSTADGSLGGLFEMSVIVGDKKAEVLTDWRKV